MCNGEVHVGQIPTWDEWAEAESRRRYLLLRDGNLWPSELTYTLSN